METSRNGKGEVGAPASRTDEETGPGIRVLVSVEPFRVPPGQEHSASCQRCGKATPRGYQGTNPSSWLGQLDVCTRCGIQLSLCGTPAGCVAVNEALIKKLPRLYRDFEFSSFRDYSEHLASVRKTVVAWAKDVAAMKQSGSFYLFSATGRHGSGSGNGKSSLLNAAFKYVARRRANYQRREWDEGDWWNDTTFFEEANVWFDAEAYDLKRDVTDYYLRMKKQGYLEPFSVMRAERSFGFDDYVRLYLGRAVPVLFLDDVGRGVGQHGMLSQAYEDLLNERAINQLPTFMTSNYSPEDLNEVLGARSVSRILRNNCQVIVVRAPDYAAIKDRLLMKPA